MKKSGLGREHGIEAVDEYLETKSVVISTDDDAPTQSLRDAVNLPQDPSAERSAKAGDDRRKK